MAEHTFWSGVMYGAIFATVCYVAVFILSGAKREQFLGKHALPEQILILKRVLPPTEKAGWIRCEQQSPCEGLEDVGDYYKCQNTHMSRCMSLLTPERQD